MLLGVGALQKNSQEFIQRCFRLFRSRDFCGSEGLTCLLSYKVHSKGAVDLVSKKTFNMHKDPEAMRQERTWNMGS